MLSVKSKSKMKILFFLFSDECKRLLRLSLDEFSLPNFYNLFGISKVQSAATTAFRSTMRSAGERWSGADRSFSLSCPDRERLSLTSLATITEALYEILEICQDCVGPECSWHEQWTQLARSFAFRYNPALQPRGLIVFGCISKRINDVDIKNLLRVLVKALESFSDITLIESIVISLTRLQPLLRAESPIHKSLFWVSLSILQLDEISLYGSGMAMLEQNLITLDNQGVFDKDNIANVMLATREPLEWYFKQLDHSVGLSFKANFHFAFVGHLIKGYRHPHPTIVNLTTRVLSRLLDIVAKPTGKDKYEVTKDNVAYLAALVAVSEEVRSRCHVRHTFSESPIFDSFAVGKHLPKKDNGSRRPTSGLTSPVNETFQHPPANQRQKSLEMMEQPPDFVCLPPPPPKSIFNQGPPANAVGGKLSSAMKANSINKEDEPKLEGAVAINPSNLKLDLNVEEEDIKVNDPAPPAPPVPEGPPEDEEHEEKGKEMDEDDETTRPSISNDINILLDPEILNDQVTQVLVLTVMATLVKYTTNESEVRILYEYLAEASVVFPKVFPVIHSLLDAKITNVLSLCHDKTILAAVQSIIENMIACEDDKSAQQLHYLQTCGFGGLWRFAGPFSQANCNAENVELFLNSLEALVETCLPGEDNEENMSFNSLLSMNSHFKLSSSLTSLSMNSPTEKTPGSRGMMPEGFPTGAVPTGCRGNTDPQPFLIFI